MSPDRSGRDDATDSDTPPTRSYVDALLKGNLSDDELKNLKTEIGGAPRVEDDDDDGARTRFHTYTAEERQSSRPEPDDDEDDARTRFHTYSAEERESSRPGPDDDDEDNARTLYRPSSLPEAPPLATEEDEARTIFRPAARRAEVRRQAVPNAAWTGHPSSAPPSSSPGSNPPSTARSATGSPTSRPIASAPPTPAPSRPGASTPPTSRPVAFPPPTPQAAPNPAPPSSAPAARRAASAPPVARSQPPITSQPPSSAAPPSSVPSARTPLPPPASERPLVELGDLFADDIPSPPPTDSGAGLRSYERRALDETFLDALGGAESMPRIALSPDALKALPLGAGEGFLLSRVDGASSVDDLIDLSSLPRLDTLRILYELLQQGVITVARR